LLLCRLEAAKMRKEIARCERVGATYNPCAVYYPNLKPQ
jgi:hypothetical protein